MLNHRGDILLLLGLAVWSIAFAMAGLPILGFMALSSLGPAALVLFILSMWRGRNGTASLTRQSMGLAFLFLGLVALIWVSLETNRLAYQWAVATQPYPHVARGSPPSIGEWLGNAAGWLLPALLCGVGLRLWTSRSGMRCLGWASAVFAVHPAKLLIYRLMLLTNPVLVT